MTEVTAARPSTLRKLAVAVACLSLLALAGCATGEAQDSSFARTRDSGSDSVTLLDEPWDDLQAENVIAKQLLDKLGYTANIDSVAVDVGAKSMEAGKIDAFLGNWWPSQRPTFGSMIDSGKVKVVGTLLTGTEYAPAVPGAAAQKLHVSSLADLSAHADAFGRKIYGIEAGTPGNATVQKMIDHNDYGLGDWKLVQSSTPAMLAQVQRAMRANQPIVFLGWSPHWMTVQFHTVFLKDPKQVWGGAGEIRTIVTSDFAKTSPDIARLLAQMKFSADEASSFYYQHDKQGKAYGDIARAWIQAHPDAVKDFLAGVSAANGKPAASVVFGS